MPRPYFERTPLDARFYEEHLKPRLPKRIFDVHVHLNLPEHIAMVPEERWRTDWALESGHLLPVEDAYACARELFPEARYAIAGMPWPIREADLAANNRYLAGKRAEGLLHPFLAVRPEWDPEEIERELLEGGFVGFKPYGDMVSGVKGAELSIFDFLPRRQLEILGRHGRALLLHLPRRERIADPDNVRELREILERYPRVTVHSAAALMRVDRKGRVWECVVKPFGFERTPSFEDAVYPEKIDPTPRWCWIYYRE